MTDETKKLVAELLPCNCESISHYFEAPPPMGEHWGNCAAIYRPAVESLVTRLLAENAAKNREIEILRFSVEGYIRLVAEYEKASRP